MKNIIVLVMFLGLSNIIIATPIKVDAGKDTNYCFNGNTGIDITIHIGGKPTASDGVAPYKYSWELYSKTTKAKLSLLVDSSKNTLSNFDLMPTMSFGNDIYVFKLTVTDNNQNTITDSCTIGVSCFLLTALYANSKQFISDSVILTTSSTAGGILPYSYRWFPTTGVSNPNLASPKVKPNIDTAHQNYQDYQAEITDAIGCINIDNGTRVFVVPTGIEKLSQGKLTFVNPVYNSGTMNFTIDLLGSTLQVYSSNGEMQYQTKVDNVSVPIGSHIPTAGVYFYKLTTLDGKSVSGRFVRE
jgi:hypothetical protein